MTVVINSVVVVVTLEFNGPMIDEPLVLDIVDEGVRLLAILV